MGKMTFYRPIVDFDGLDNHLKSLILGSINHGHDDDAKHPSRSISFNGRDSEPVIKMKSLGSMKIRIRIKGSLSFNGRDFEKNPSSKTSIKNNQDDCFVKSVCTRKRKVSIDQLPRSGSNLSDKNLNSLLSEPQSHKHKAALKLQKVYKSFRTRRQLADCAVLAEQRWWKVLDFAELKRTSISFFDIEKPESAISRWSRAKRRVAKVGKGLSKDGKARKLALQHWLEAIDPRHRYGHNLQFYYVKWLHCDSNQPFFYWLDIGQGKEVNLEICSRQKLLQQCIKYLGPVERKAYQVIIEDGRLFYKQSGNPVDTSGDTKWIFVLSTSKTLYVGQKSKGTFQHSSFLAGGATLSAGRLVVEDGILKAAWPHSGHYLPTEENFQEFMSFLKEHNVDLTNVKECPNEDEEENIARENKEHMCQGNPLEAELPQNNEIESSNISTIETFELRNEDSKAEPNPQLPMSRLSKGLKSRISRLEIPKIDNMSAIFKKPKQPTHRYSKTLDSIANGYETVEESFIDEEEFMVPKSNLFKDDEKERDANPIPKDKIMKRIDSHKGMKSYQLAHHLATRWTTGAGPRIGCMRDYPAELQFQVLEQVNLSPSTRGTPAASPHIPSRTPVAYPQIASPSRFSLLATPVTKVHSLQEKMVMSQVKIEQ